MTSCYLGYSDVLLLLLLIGLRRAIVLCLWSSVKSHAPRSTSVEHQYTRHLTASRLNSDRQTAAADAADDDVASLQHHHCGRHLSVCPSVSLSQRSASDALCVCLLVFQVAGKQVELEMSTWPRSRLHAPASTANSSTPRWVGSPPRLEVFHRPGERS